MRAFTMTDFLITMSVLFLFLVVLAVLAYREARNKKREADKWPSARRKKYSRIINDKLGIDFDPTQDMYN